MVLLFWYNDNEILIQTFYFTLIELNVVKEADRSIEIFEL